jgi:hypothetical protein
MVVLLSVSLGSPSGEPVYTHPNRWSWNAQLATASTAATQRVCRRRDGGH